MEYVFWAANARGNFCVLSPLEWELSFLLKKGESLLKDFPKDLSFHMSDRHRKNIKLADNIRNSNSCPIISPKIVEFIKKETTEFGEFLPITIINHKGRIASKEYQIMNPLKVIDCIDIEKSKVEWNSISKNKIDDWEQLILIKEKIDNDAMIFRLKYNSNKIAIRHDLAEKIQQAGFTGIYFTKPENTESY